MLEQHLTSGNQRIFDGCLGWARTYLAKAGLISRPRRATVEITEDGEELLKENPKVIDLAILKHYGNFREFLARNKDEQSKAEAPDSLSSRCWMRWHWRLQRRSAEKIDWSGRWRSLSSDCPHLTADPMAQDHPDAPKQFGIRISTQVMELVSAIQEHRKATKQPITLAAIVEDAIGIYYDALVKEGAISDK